VEINQQGGVMVRKIVRALFRIGAILWTLLTRVGAISLLSKGQIQLFEFLLMMAFNAVILVVSFKPPKGPSGSNLKTYRTG